MGKEKKIIEILTVTSMILSGCKPAVNVPSQEKTVAGMVGTAEPLFTQTPYPKNTKTFPVDIPSVTVTPTVTATERPTVTATPEKFSIEAISFVPKSVEEIGKSVEVRSPITDPEGYKEDIEKVIAVIHEKILPNYQGEFITGDKQQVAVGNGKVTFGRGVVLEPVAAVYFNWEYNGTTYKVPRFFFPAKDSQGEFTLSVVLNPIIVKTAYKATVDNPAPDWRMAEIIKRFPMKTNDRGYIWTYYSRQSFVGPLEQDPFYGAYLKEPEDDLGGAYRGWIVDGKPFDRSVEDEAVVILGGQG